MVALEGFPRSAVKFNSNKGSLSPLTYLSLNELMQTLWKEKLLDACLLIVGQIPSRSSTCTTLLI